MDEFTVELDLDFSILGKTVSCKCAEIIFDSNHLPDGLEITVSAPEKTDWNNISHWGGKVFEGRTVSGTLEDGRTMRMTLTAHTQISPRLPDWDVTLKYLIDNTVIDAGSRSGVETVQCSFNLTNVSLFGCDEVTTHPLPPGLDPSKCRPGWTLNRGNFVLDGREWALIDKTVANEKPSNGMVPSLTATLSTTVLYEHERSAIPCGWPGAEDRRRH